jgi:Histidine kinase
MIDWSQLWYPGPKRVFSAEEMARAGSDALPRTAVVVALVNAACMASAMMQLAPAAATAQLLGLIVAAFVGGWVGVKALWRAPTRRGLLVWSMGAAAAFVVVMLGLRLRGPRDEVTMALVACASALLLMAMLAWWFVCLYRAEQVAARLREQDERAQAVAAARQLATAQVQPHFLFNSLASLQHWVQAKDDRAAPLLDALMGFLRTTLPLFDRPLLRVADEAEAVRHYLGVMQLRLGERLRWTVEIDAGAADALLPPGLLLTLVENAIEHGVQQSLSGAALSVRVDRVGERLRIDVRDGGPGPAPGAVDGVGLTNARARLAQAFGSTATLTLERAADGGTLARIECPLATPAS